MNSQDLTKGTLWKQMLLFFFPIALGTIFQQLYNAVDAIIVGKYVGTEALAAVGGTPGVYINFLISVFVGLTGGSAVIIAQLYGAGKHKMLEKATGTAITFCLVLGAVLTITATLLTDPVLRLLGTPEDTMADSATYLRIYFAGTILMLLLNIESGILRAVGDSRSPLIYMIISCVSNIVLDLLFVIQFGLGVAGVAYATVIAEFINTALLTVKLIRTKEPYRITRRGMGLDPGLLRQMLAIGIPAAIQGAIYAVCNMIQQAAVNGLGTQTVAAWVLAGKIDGIYWGISGAGGTTVTTFAGQNFGAGNRERVENTFKTGMKVFVPMTLILCGALLPLGPTILPLFTEDAELIKMTFYMMCFFVPFYVFWTVIEVTTGTLRGCGDVKIPTLITILGIGLFRVIWLATVYRADPCVETVAVTYAISWILTSIAMLIYYHKNKNRILSAER